MAKLTDKKMVVSALTPRIINSRGFSLVDGLAKLQTLARLPIISNAVSVSSVLVFKKTK